MLTTLSQTSLQDYVDCPRRFHLRYVEQLTYPAVESEPALENEQHVREGEYFHRLVQQYFVGIPAEQVARRANTPNLQRWWQNFTTSSEVAGLQGLQVSAEANFSAPLGPLRLLAKYDLIASGDGRFIIYDWKTYRKRPRNEFLAARMQTRIYRALLARTGAHLNHGQPIAPEQIEMVYWFADFPNDPARFPYTAAQYQRDWELFTQLADEIHAASDYPLTDDRTKCLFCPYRSYCERGIRAGEAEQAEAEMEAEELFDVNFEQIGEIAF